MNIEKDEVLNATIKFTISEIHNLIIALVIATDSASNLSQMEYANNFSKLRKDLVKIKDDLINKGV